MRRRRSVRRAGRLPRRRAFTGCHASAARAAAHSLYRIQRRPADPRGLQASLPAPLAGKPPQELEAAWPAWTAAHDAAIRARLAQGDEDSVVNFWLYGTSSQPPRATAENLARLPRPDIENLLVARLDDLVRGITASGTNDRLRFARQVVERHGIDPGTDAGADKAREYLVAARERVIGETERHRREAEAARTTARGGAALEQYCRHDLPRPRTSSDTSLPVGFAVDRALAALASGRNRGAPPSNGSRSSVPASTSPTRPKGSTSTRRRRSGPFALIDSLLRLGLAQAPTCA